MGARFHTHRSQTTGQSLRALESGLVLSGHIVPVSLCQGTEIRFHSPMVQSCFPRAWILLVCLSHSGELGSVHLFPGIKHNCCQRQQENFSVIQGILLSPVGLSDTWCRNLVSQCIRLGPFLAGRTGFFWSTEVLVTPNVRGWVLFSHCRRMVAPPSPPTSSRRMLASRTLLR